MDFASKKVVELKEECRTRKIKISGNKNELIVRLNQYESDRVSQTQISTIYATTYSSQYLSSQNLTQIQYEIQDELIADTVFSTESNVKERSRSTINWKFIQSYECLLDFEIPDFWRYNKSTQTKAGDKEYFICNIDKSCKAGMFILYHVENNTISVYHNDQLHLHDNPRKVNEWGIDEAIKIAIKRNKIVNEDFYIVNKLKYKHLINDFEKLVTSKTCELNFDGLAEVIQNVFLVNVCNESWINSTCTCRFYLKKYIYAHIIIVSVSLKLVIIPNHCKNVKIDNKKKPGKPSNASKGLSKQANVV